MAVKRQCHVVESSWQGLRPLLSPADWLMMIISIADWAVPFPPSGANAL